MLASRDNWLPAKKISRPLQSASRRLLRSLVVAVALPSSFPCAAAPPLTAPPLPIAFTGGALSPAPAPPPLAVGRRRPDPFSRRRGRGRGRGGLLHPHPPRLASAVSDRPLPTFTLTPPRRRRRTTAGPDPLRGAPARARPSGWCPSARRGAGGASWPVWFLGETQRCSCPRVPRWRSAPPPARLPRLRPTPPASYPAAIRRRRRSTQPHPDSALCAGRYHHFSGRRFCGFVFVFACACPAIVSSLHSPSSPSLHGPQLLSPQPLLFCAICGAQ